MDSNRCKSTRMFVYSFLLLKYKLRTKENVVHDPFGRSDVRHGIDMPGKVPHQFMLVITTHKAGLKPPELVPRVHLGHHQGNGGSTADAVEGNLLSAHRNVLETICQQVTSGIQSPSGIICRQLEGLQMPCQDYNKRVGDLAVKERQDEDDRG